MVSTTLVECLWKWEMCDVKFLFFFAADMCTYSHILGYFYLLIFFVVSGIYLLWSRYALRLSIFCACFDDFSYQIFRSGWNVVSLWIGENLNFMNVLQYFCAIWFCAILHLILCNILHLIFVCWYIFFIFVAVQHYRFKNFYLFIFCILHSAYPNLRRYSFLVALLVLHLCKWLSMYL